MAVQDRVARRRLSRPGRRIAGWALVALALPAVSCQPPFEGIEPELYVEVMAQLSFASTRFFDGARVDSARRALLEEYGVAAEDLVAFSEHYGDDPAVMISVWQAIQARHDSLQAGADGDSLGAAPR